MAEMRRVLRVADLSLAPGKVRFSVAMPGGEIVGLAGLDGQGQERFLETLAGLAPANGGEIVVGTVAGAIVLTELNTLLIGLRLEPSLVQAALGLVVLVLVSLYGREAHVRNTI